MSEKNSHPSLNSLAACLSSYIGNRWTKYTFRYSIHDQYSLPWLARASIQSMFFKRDAFESIECTKNAQPLKTQRWGNLIICERRAERLWIQARGLCVPRQQQAQDEWATGRHRDLPLTQLAGNLPAAHPPRPLYRANAHLRGLDGVKFLSVVLHYQY